MDQERMHACEHLVAAAVIEFMAEKGEPTAQVRDLFEDDALRGKDFALLGLSSLDWMTLAMRVEKRSGVELDDAVLIDPENRSVAGWAACLYSVGALT
ncbi:hypothetical protein Srufu_020110 [Streptomyces libani subsp. rufus]|nr:hypothetical protein Srufu_020110 [Streptomyces libani subsp. rufus]